MIQPVSGETIAVGAAARIRAPADAEAWANVLKAAGD
jgi:hypothetical protein